jgi:hypothetical protein
MTPHRGVAGEPLGNLEDLLGGRCASRLSWRGAVFWQLGDDALAGLLEAEASVLGENLGCDTFTLADDAEKDVLGADVVVAELQRLTQ